MQGFWNILQGRLPNQIWNIPIHSLRTLQCCSILFTTPSMLLWLSFQFVYKANSASIPKLLTSSSILSPRSALVLLLLSLHDTLQARHVSSGCVHFWENTHWSKMHAHKKLLHLHHNSTWITCAKRTADAFSVESYNQSITNSCSRQVGNPWEIQLKLPLIFPQYTPDWQMGFPRRNICVLAGGRGAILIRLVDRIG
jgi:hypothetical protein